MSAPNLQANYAPFILNHLADVAEDNAPETKVTPTGFLKCILEHDPKIMMPASERLRLNTENGNIKQIRLSYLRRILPSQTSTTDDCSNNIVPIYSDFVLQAPRFRSFSLYISDETLAHYVEDAAASKRDGTPPTELMNEHMRTVMTVVNGLVGAIDTDLLGDVVFGKNQVTGVNTAKTVNIEKDATLFDLSTGWAQIFDDLDNNEFFGTPLLVGSGLFNKFMKTRKFSSPPLSGMNQSEVTDFQWYLDLYAKTTFGTNNVGIFSEGSIGFVDLNKYIGFRSGMKGVSMFFQMTLPVKSTQNDGTSDMMKFDCQLKYIDCPTEMFDGYNTVSVNRGWQLIISKNYGLFQIPSDAYQSDDRLEGNNGALLYNFTNNAS